MTYNYDRFAAEDYDLLNFRGPTPGSKAPDFEVESAEGGTERLLDTEGDFLVLEMGSLTCPLFQGRRPTMARLERFGKRVSSVVLYVREAHPGDKIRAHSSMDDKRACAVRLRHEEGESRRILIDDLAGRVHQAYGGYPNSVFIINRNGCIVYATDWNNPTATERALGRLLRGEVPRHRAWFKPVPPQVSLRVLGNGGRGSMSDFLRGLPRLVWNNLIVRNLRLLLAKPAPVTPETNC